MSTDDEDVRREEFSGEVFWTTLFTQTRPLVMASGLHHGLRFHDAEDMAICLFGDLWKKRDRIYDQVLRFRGTVTSGGVKAFIVGSARLAALSFGRSRSRREKNEVSGVEADASSDSTDRIEARVLVAKVVSYLQAPSTKDGKRKLRFLKLYYLDGCTLEEIGEEMGVPVGTVKSWHNRILKEIREKVTIGNA